MEGRNSNKNWWIHISDESLQKMIDFCKCRKDLKIDLLWGIVTFYELLDEKLKRNEIL